MGDFEAGIGNWDSWAGSRFLILAPIIRGPVLRSRS